MLRRPRALGALLIIVLLNFALYACGGEPPESEKVGIVDQALGGAFVQFKNTTPADPASPTSITAKFTGAQTAGDTNVVSICFFNATSTITSVVDTKGNTYSVASALFRYPAGPSSCAWYLSPHIASATANSNTVTVTFSGATRDPDLIVAEYSGLAPSPLDVGAAASGTTSLASTGNFTTTQAGDLIVASNYLSSNTSGPGSGFTKRVITSPDSDILEDKIAGAAGSYSATAPTGGGWWIMQALALKVAPTGDAGTEGGNDGSGDGGAHDGFSDSAVDGAVDSAADALVETGMESGSEASLVDAPVEAAESSSPESGTEGGSGDDATIGSDDASSGEAGVSPDAAPLDATIDSGAVTPTLVQHVSGSSLRGTGMSSPFCYTMQLPAPSQAGNAIVVGATWKGNATLHVTDDRGSTYSNGEVYFDAADNQSVGISTSFGIAAGARVLGVCFSANPGGWVQPMASEWANVIAINGASGASGVGVSANVGLTPGTDIPYQVVYTPGGPPPSFTATSGGTLLSADVRDGWAGQYGVSAMTLGASKHWASAVVLLRAGAAGSVPTGMRIVHLAHENLPYSSAAGGTNSYFADPTPLEFPSSGNLIVAAVGGGCGCSLPASVTGITDSSSNGWVLVRTQLSPLDATAQILYAGGAVTSDHLALSVIWNQTQTDDSTVMLYDVAGAASAPLDVSGGGAGEVNVAGANLTLPFTITPAVVGELVVLATPWDFDTAGGLIGGLDDTNLTSGMSESGPFPVDENNGWGHAWSASTSPMTFTWTPLFTEIEFGGYAGVGAAFKPAAP